MKSGERRARGTSFLQDISGDGRLVAFVSSATNPIPNDVVDADPNVYVRDLTTGTTELASVGSDGIRANVGFFDSPAITSGGRFVAFSTFDSLVPEDTRPFSLDIYLCDRQTGNHRTHQREKRRGVARAAPVR